MKLLKSDYLKVKINVNSFFNSCTYVISDNHCQFLVDCGDVDSLLSVLDGNKLNCVLLTHAHFDHIYGLNDLLEHYPDVLVYTNEEGQIALLNERKNMSLYHESPFIFQFPQNIRIINDNNIIELSKETKVKVIFTPGHHPSCLTYIIGDTIFTGDSYIPGIKVVTNLPKGNKKQAQESIDKILTMSEGRTIYPGHYIEDENKNTIYV